jgi:hypothetical protein
LLPTLLAALLGGQAGACRSMIGNRHRCNEIHALTRRTAMKKRLMTLSVVATAAVSALAYAQFPIMELVADKVIEKYQNASCEQLWQQRGQPKSEQEQRVIGILQSDPQMRQAFFDKVSGPIVNKMFTCGMIP